MAGRLPADQRPTYPGASLAGRLQLLGIREPEHVWTHPVRGAIFESWVFCEIYKARIHQALEPNLFHYRKSRGLEVDLLIDHGAGWDAVEIKSGATLSADFFKGLRRFKERSETIAGPRNVDAHPIYGGDDSQRRSDVRILSWRDPEDLSAPR